MQRNNSIDLLRGLIIILMALDHASAFIARVHFTEIWGVDFVKYESLSWWFTRFVSHLCAPGFFFLMGAGIILFSFKRKEQGWTSRSINRYLIIRGSMILLLMIFLEFPAWAIGTAFNQTSSASIDSIPGIHDGGFFFPTTVLYGLGICMILSILIRKAGYIILLGLCVLCFTISNYYLTGLNPTSNFSFIETLLLVPTISNYVMCLYPLVPWLGVMSLGMVFGKLLLDYGQRAMLYSLLAGSLFLALFLVLRYLNFGSLGLDDKENWISFFTLIKYPPSVQYFLLTIGLNLILLYFFSRVSDIKWLKPLDLFGKTAMFFYILHLYFYGLVGAFFPEGSSVLILYIIWALGLIPLHFLCTKFLNFKRRKPASSLWRMI